MKKIKGLCFVILLVVIVIFAANVLLSEANVTNPNQKDPNGKNPNGVTQNIWTDADNKLLESLKSKDFAVQYVRTDGFLDDVKYPIVKVIHSVEELKAYYEEQKEIYYFTGTFDSEISFEDACKKYDAAYFEKQVLVMVVLEEGSGSIRHKVKNIGISDDAIMVVEIDTLSPEVGTDDMAVWHILIEPEAGVMIEKEFDIKVFCDGRNVTDRPTNVSYTKGYAGIAFQLPKGWKYEFIENQEMGMFGFYFWPEGQEKGKLSIQYYADSFGVCGTGLKQEDMQLGQYQAVMGTYDDHKVWDYIYLAHTAGDYVIFNEGAESWWKEHGDAAMQILCTLTVGNHVITETQAIEIAKTKANIEYGTIQATFDKQTAVWSVHLYEKNIKEGKMVIQISAEGNIIDLAWEEEYGATFKATILELTDTNVLVQPLEGEEELRSSDKISFSIKDLADIGAKVGDVVEISYSGVMMESYPAQIVALGWEKVPKN